MDDGANNSGPSTELKRKQRGCSKETRADGSLKVSVLGYAVLFCKKIFAGTKKYLPVLTLGKFPK